MNVNVCGVVVASKAVLCGMMERRRRVILNIVEQAPARFFPTDELIDSE